MEQSFFGALAAHGLPGLIIFALGAWIVVLHRELRDERKARIDDVKGFTETLIGMNGQILNAVEKLSDVATVFQERDRDRDAHRRGPR